MGRSFRHQRLYPRRARASIAPPFGMNRLLFFCRMKELMQLQDLVTADEHQPEDRRYWRLHARFSVSFTDCTSSYGRGFFAQIPIQRLWGLYCATRRLRGPRERYVISKKKTRLIFLNNLLSIGSMGKTTVDVQSMFIPSCIFRSSLTQLQGRILKQSGSRCSKLGFPLLQSTSPAFGAWYHVPLSTRSCALYAAYSPAIVNPRTRPHAALLV